MSNSESVFSVLTKVIVLVDDLPRDCPDSVLNDGFNAVRGATLGCMRRLIEVISDNVKLF